MGEMGGGGFLVKDLRTALATKMAAAEISKNADCCKDQKAYKAAVKQVGTVVSSVLNNRPQQAVESYIDPTVWSAWQCPGCSAT
jgi:DNA topoisomerase IB